MINWIILYIDTAGEKCWLVGQLKSHMAVSLFRQKEVFCMTFHVSRWPANMYIQ